MKGVLEPARIPLHQLDIRLSAREAVTETRKAIMWLLLAALAALVSYWSFRGYLAAEFLIGFANSLYC